MNALSFPDVYRTAFVYLSFPEIISTRSNDAAGKDKFVDRNELIFRILRRAGDPYLMGLPARIRKCAIYATAF